MLYVLNQVGLSHKDITIVPMATDQAGTAFLAGKVDAAITWEPLLSQALEREGSSILVSSEDIDPILVDVLYMGKEFLNQRPEDAKKLVAALNEANELWKSNQEQYLPLLDKYRGWGESELAATMTTVELYEGNSQRTLLGNKNSKFYDMFDTAANLWYKAAASRFMYAVAFSTVTYVLLVCVK